MKSIRVTVYSILLGGIIKLFCFKSTKTGLSSFLGRFLCTGGHLFNLSLHSSIFGFKNALSFEGVGVKRTRLAAWLGGRS